MTKRKRSRLTPKEARALVSRIQARPSRLTIGGAPIGNDDGVLVDAAVALQYLITELRGLRKKVERAAATTTDPETASRLRAALSVGPDDASQSSARRNSLRSRSTIPGR